MPLKHNIFMLPSSIAMHLNFHKIILYAFSSVFFSLAYGYDSPEHIIVGSNTNIIIPTTSTSDMVRMMPNTFQVEAKDPDYIPYFILPTSKGKDAFPNGISYGELNALSGDYFANPSDPISLGENQEDRILRAVDFTYKVLYSEKNITAMNSILSKLRVDTKKVGSSLRNAPFESTYKEIRLLNKEEGDVAEKALGFEQYYAIDIENYNHFHDTAIKASNALHILAMRVAKSAGEKQSGSFTVKLES
jgi:hypothetical protein